MKAQQIWLMILVALLILPGLTWAEGYTCEPAENKDGITVMAIPETEEGNNLIIPPAIDGQTVRYLDAGCIPEMADTVFLPDGAEVSHAEKLGKELRVYSYKDYEMIHSQKSIMYYFAAVEQGEYALTDAVRILPGGETELLKQEFYEYPTELNGRKLYNCLSKKDYYILYRNSGCDYYKISDSEIGICNYLGAGNKVSLPEQIDGMTVVAVNSLDSNWIIFAGKTKSITFPSTIRLFGNYVVFAKVVSNIKIPEGVTEIGSYAIKGDKITKIDIPSNVTTIGVRAFDTKMKTLKLPANIEKLAERAFINSRYTTISLPEGMKAVPRDLCMNSPKLNRVDFPESLNRIGEQAFMDCVKLQSVTIPAEVSEIAAAAFKGCKNLKTVNFKGEKVRNIEAETFAGCGFGKLVIPNGVEEIGSRAFAGCARLSSAEIPETVAIIGPEAFSTCGRLQNVKMTENVRQIADDAFDNCGKNLTFTVPEGSYAGQWAENKGFKVKVAKKK